MSDSAFYGTRADLSSRANVFPSPRFTIPVAKRFPAFRADETPPGPFVDLPKAAQVYCEWFVKKKTESRRGKMRAEQATPTHYTGDKAEYVREMFAGIAHRYDLLNDILSFHLHKSWRRFAVRLARLRPGDAALDICTGTGDFAIDLYRAVGPTGFVLGSDFCAPMIQQGREKIERASQGQIRLMLADALRLPYRSNLFDCVTVGFGIRNVADTQQAFREMARVAKPGGRVVCLEFTTPRNRFLRTVVHFYEMRLLPRIGALLSRSEAYTYLPKSIQVFHSREEMKAMMEKAGLADIQILDMNFGSVCIHLGTKR
jgi:demethylmenaquinone methyltransferase/2-methoxy-6-polyprenyl-1,4-benzoquinol methylase